MSIGIRSCIMLAANQAVAASVAPVTLTGFSIALAPAQKVHARLWVPFTLAATGGFRFIWTPSVAPVNFLNSFLIGDETTGGVQTVFYGTVQTASAAFANAAAVAGNYILQSEISVTGGATASTLAFQFACNTAANAITALAGAYCDFTLL